MMAVRLACLAVLGLLLVQMAPTVESSKNIFGCGGRLMGKQFPPCNRCTYKIETVTGSQTYAGTDAAVYLSIEGTKGSCDDLRLDNAGDEFEPGQTDTFTVNCRCLGCLKKMTIHHDNTGLRPPWYLKTIAISQETPALSDPFLQTFTFSRWLSDSTSVTIKKSETEYP